MFEELSKQISGEIRIGELLSKHTSFKIGGPADFLVYPQDENELKTILTFAKAKKLPVFVLGKGTNLLVRDNGVRGIVIKLDNLNRVLINNSGIFCQSGFPLQKLSNIAADDGLSGLEFACGIPGSVGGAIFMNAGAFGGCMADVVRKVTVMDYNGNTLELNSNQLGFGYRKSIFQDKKFIILNAELELNKGNKLEIKDKMRLFQTERRKTQPQGFPNAGSIFRIPNIFSITKASLFFRLILKIKNIFKLSNKFYFTVLIKYLRLNQIGGAKVSNLNLNFILNINNATAKDVIELMEDVKNKVKKKFNVSLEPEIEIVAE